MSKAESSFVYVTFIRTTPEQLWSALTTADFMKQYWFGVHFKTDWKVGAHWALVYPDGRMTDQGEILEMDPPKRLVLTWRHERDKEVKDEGGEALCVMELEPVPASDVVKLTITHTMDRADSKLIKAVSGGWPRIISNLKSLLETGQVIMKVKN